MLNIPTTEERLGKSPNRLVRFFVLLMATVYLGMGIGLWYTANTATGGGIIELGPIARRVLGTVFIFYGLYRFGRGYKTHFSKKTSDDNHA